MNSNKLKALMVEKGITRNELIDTMKKKGVETSRSSIHRKLKGETEFTRKEIATLAEILEMSDEQIMDIFFNEKVA